MGNCSTTQRATNYSGGKPAELDSKALCESKTVLHSGPILGIAYRGKGELFTCSDDRAIAKTHIDPRTHKITSGPDYFLGHTKAVNRIFTGVDAGSTGWSCSRDLSLRMWDLDAHACLKEIANSHELNIMAVTNCPSDASIICSGSRDYSVKSWDVESGTCKVTYSLPRNIVTTLESSAANPHMLYQGAEDLFVRVWDTRNPSHHAPAQVISGYVYFPVSMDVHAEGQLLATGCKGFDSVGCTVKVWDLRNTSQPLADYAGHSQDVVGCKFSTQNPDLLVSASKDGSIRVWDTKQALTSSGNGAVDSSACVASIPHSGKIISCLAVPQEHAVQHVCAGLSSQNSFAVGSNDGSVMVANIMPAGSDDAKKYSIDIQLTTAAYFDKAEPDE